VPSSHAATNSATPRVRELLNRRELAATRHRLAVRRRLALDEAEMLAIEHLALHHQPLLALDADVSDLEDAGLVRITQRNYFCGNMGVTG
jgi:hypothetical protein